MQMEAAGVCCHPLNLHLLHHSRGGSSHPSCPGPRPSSVLSLTSHSQSIRRIRSWGFPGGTVDKNLLADAGDMGSIPGGGGAHVPRSNQAPRPLSLCDWSPHCNQRSRRGEKPAPRKQRKSHQSNRDPEKPKLKYINAHKHFQKENQLQHVSKNSATPRPAHHHCPGP